MRPTESVIAIVVAVTTRLHVVVVRVIIRQRGRVAVEERIVSTEGGVIGWEGVIVGVAIGRVLVRSGVP
jgi:urea transporter